jgi:DNA-binding NarL/FixJ family response regulator
MGQTNKIGLTKLSIVNQALSLIGSERVQLSAIDDTGSIAEQAILHYDPAVQELTRMHAWNCCLHRVALSEGDGADAALSFAQDWGYPAEAQRIIYISKVDTKETVRPKIDFAVTTAVNSTVTVKNIQTDVTAAFAQYLAVPDEADMDMMYVSCLRTLLASKLAVPVAGDVNRKFELLKYFYEKLLPEARRANTMEGVNEPAVDESYLETPMSPFTYKAFSKV